MFQITVCERSKNRVQYLNDKICCLDKVIIYLLASISFYYTTSILYFAHFIHSSLLTYNFLSSKKYEEKSLTSPGSKWRDWTGQGPFSPLHICLTLKTALKYTVLGLAVVRVAALVGIICSLFYPAPIEHKENFSLFRTHKCYQKRVSA